MPELVESKARLVTLAAARAGVRADRTTARDLASEIEWAKSSLVEPDDYAVAAAKALREPPLDAAKVGAVFAAYEQVKRANGVIDFEDLLRAAVWAIEEHPDVAEQVHAQYRHFVVDEYQDVNPLQQRLLEAWLGERARPDRGRRREPDDLLVHRRVQLATCSTSPALGTATPSWSGWSATTGRRRRSSASPTRSSGRPAASRRSCGWSWSASGRPAPSPTSRFFADEPAEAAAVAARCAELIAGGVPAREIAVLFRTNAQSEAYEEALAEAGVPYVVHGAERFFERPEIRQAMIALRSAEQSTPAETPLAERRGRGAGGGRLAARASRRPAAPPGSGGRRWPRWSGWPRSSRGPAPGSRWLRRCRGGDDDGAARTSRFG